MGVPTLYVRLLQDGRLTPRRRDDMRLFICGWHRFDRHLRRSQARAGHAILERYGMSETQHESLIPYDGERIAGRSGVSATGVEVRVTDPEKCEVLAGRGRRVSR